MKLKIVFKVDGKEYSGVLSGVSGAGNMWHLMVNNYYQGQLVYTDSFGWQFTSNKYEGKPLGGYFASFLPDQFKRYA